VTPLDWIIIAILAVSIVLAASQGFMFEVFSLAGAVVGYLLAAWEYKRAAVWFLPYVKNDWAAEAAGFIVIFLAVVVLAGIIGRIARWAVHGVGLRWFDRLLGGAFGLLRGALVVMVMVMAMASFGPGSRMLSDSSLGQYFLVLGRGAMWASPYEFRDKFRQGLKAIEDLRAGKSPLPSNHGESKPKIPAQSTQKN
jgi:membrane protein required for colicin V production